MYEKYAGNALKAIGGAATSLATGGATTTKDIVPLLLGAKDIIKGASGNKNVGTALDFIADNAGDIYKYGKEAVKLGGTMLENRYNDDTLE